MAVLLIGCRYQKPDFDAIRFSFYNYGGNVVCYTINVQNENIEILQLKISLKEIKDNQNVIRFIKDSTIQNKDLIVFDNRFANKLYKKIHEIGYDSSITLSTGRYGRCHGFIFEKIQNYDTTKIICSCPQRSDSVFQQEFQLLDVFFDFAFKISNKEKCDSITKQLYGLYGGKIQFIRVAEHPLEFEIIGNITPESLERDSLSYVEFFKSLPTDELVLIDLTYTSTSWDRVFCTDNIYFFGYTDIAFHKENYMKARKKLGSFSNDTLWLNENRSKDSVNDYLYSKNI